MLQNGESLKANFGPGGRNLTQKSIADNELEDGPLRLRLLKYSLQILWQNPLGIGPFKFRSYLLDLIQKKKHGPINGLIFDPHNEYLRLGISFGLPVFIFCQFLVIYCGWKILIWPRSEQRSILLAVLAPFCWHWPFPNSWPLLYLSLFFQ